MTTTAAPVALPPAIPPTTRAADQAFAACHARTVRIVRARALRSLASLEDAEDATQETYVRAWRHWATIGMLTPDRQVYWLLRVIGNICHDVVRQRQVVYARFTPMTMDTVLHISDDDSATLGALLSADQVAPHEADRLTRLGGGDEGDWVERLDRAVFWRAVLAYCTQRQGEIVTLLLQGYTYTEAAERLGISPNGVKNTMYHLRARLAAPAARRVAALLHSDEV